MRDDTVTRPTSTSFTHRWARGRGNQRVGNENDCGNFTSRWSGSPVAIVWCWMRCRWCRVVIRLGDGVGS